MLLSANTYILDYSWWYSVPRPGGSWVNMLDSWPGGCEFRYQVEANFLSGVFSPLTYAEVCEKSSR